MTSARRQTLLAVLAVLVLVAFLEAILNLLALASPRVAGLLASPWESGTPGQIIPDERLRYRPNPAFPGHDARGFRNPQAPAAADIVALGDSQTYGTGVAAGEAWPRQLERLAGRPVYSMAFGGYGPVHSLILWDEAVTLAPSIIIEALYAGNDLYDAFNIVYNQGQYAGLQSTDPRLQEQIRAAEAAEPVAEHVVRIARMGASATRTARTRHEPPGFLARHSRLYGLLRRLRYELRNRNPPESPDAWADARKFAAAHPDYTQVFTDGRFRTVFTAEYRLAALDLADPRIAEGGRIVLRAIERMHARAIARNIRFIVLLIPTKELVFAGLWDDPAPAYRSLTQNESTFWRTVRETLERADIEYIDALPALRAQLLEGVQPYPPGHDGHPNADGHRAIAGRVADYLAAETAERSPSGNSGKPVARP